jgi:hypothetical protein
MDGRRTFTGIRGTLAGMVIVVLLLSNMVSAGHARESADPAVPAAGADLASVDPRWWQGNDFIVTGSGDTSGYHLQIGLERQRYAFRPLASIQPRGYDVDDWLGYECVMGDRRSVLVTLLPRWAVNRPVLRDRGALAYLVSIPDGEVTPLVAGVAFKYHAIGCGSGSTAALLRHLDSDQARTELLTVDTRTGTVSPFAIVDGQLTNPVPTSHDRLLALSGRQVVRLTRDSARLEPVAVADGTPFRLAAAAGDAAEFLVLRDGTVEARRVEGAALRRLGSGPAGQVQLLTGAAGRNVIVGLSQVAAVGPALTAHLPRAGHVADAVSADGKVVLGVAATGTAVAGAEHAQHAGAGSGEDLPGSWSHPQLFAAVDGRPLETWPPRDTAVTLTQAPAAYMTESSTAGVGVEQFTTPACAVPRNNPRRTSYHALPAQVNWAVEMASRNLLTGANSRPANYLSSNLPAYSPSVDFGLPALKPSGGRVPPALMNGVLAQESAYRSASRRSLQGSAGNAIISDYYGAAGTLDLIDYDAADCGYGIAQVTTGMRASDTSISANGKAKIAIDYAENIQAGMNILVKKWNQLYDAGIRLNDSNPAYLENWYLALWAYNSGVQPDGRFGNDTGCTPSPSCTDDAGNWGLGWTNNPMNNDYPPDRGVFLRQTYADAEHPADWPYQERVLGWAETPILNYEGIPSYEEAQPGSRATGLFAIRYPDYHLFCTASNSCDPNTGDRCQLSSRRCWWHRPVTFAQCQGGCAISPFRLPTNATEPGGDNPWPPACNSNLGSDAIIVDDLSDPGANVFCPNRNWSNSGSFSYDIGTAANGAPLGVIDFHQLATGLGGHTWFAGNRVAGDTAHRVVGTWDPDIASAGTYLVRAHIPTAGATAGSAVYRITTAGGSVQERVMNQHEHYNHWKTLGLFQLDGNAKVELSNVTKFDTAGGTGTVAWDAMAFVPVAGTFVQRTVDAVALFDEDTNLDTAFPASWFRTPFANRQELYDWALRISGNVLAAPACGSGPTPCVQPRTRAAMQRWRDAVMAAGTHPTNHPDGRSIPAWIGFANLYTDRPTGPSKPPWYETDDGTYKIRQEVTVSYVLGADNRIVPGSADATYRNRTGDTHLPTFVVDAISAIAHEYPAAGAPDLAYATTNLTQHDHQSRTVNPNTTGVLPGRAYAFAGTSPVVTNYSSDPVGGGGTCVRTLSTSGGSIGYRPMLGVGYVSAEVEAWTQRADAASSVPQPVADLTGEIFNAFFKGGLNGSVFNQAPPIWQELNMLTCVDGTIRPAGGEPMFRHSYMPNQYLYRDGSAMNAGGTPSGSAAPVFFGDFHHFSTLPLDPTDPTGNPFNPFQQCTPDRDPSAGNPWGIWTGNAPGADPPRVRFCLDPDLPVDTHG